MTELTLLDYMDLAILKNYMISILITSSAQAKLPSLGFDYGPGKSTLALWFLNNIYAGNWEKTKDNCIATPNGCKKILDRGYRTTGFLWDDMQMTVGKHQAHNLDVREFAYYLTTTRPYFAIMIGTAPHRGMLQKDFREFFHFEIIVPQRGIYEVQQLKHWIDFKNPTQIKDRLKYKGESPFPSLPPDIQVWYDNWRDENNRKIRSKLRIFKEWEEGNELNIERLSDKEIVLFKQIRDDGHRTRQAIWQSNQKGLAERMRVLGFLEREGNYYIISEEARNLTI